MSEPKFKPKDMVILPNDHIKAPMKILTDGHEDSYGSIWYLYQAPDGGVHQMNEARMSPIPVVTFTEAQIEEVEKIAEDGGFLSARLRLGEVLRRDHSEKNQPPTEGTGETL